MYLVLLYNKATIVQIKCLIAVPNLGLHQLEKDQMH